MLLGISDTWVDGLESYVLVAADAATPVLARFWPSGAITWRLALAEKETALLKGLSHKRNARLTSRSERTVRQHAVSVYRKSELAGRAELAGFFLDDLLLPEGGRGEAPPADDLGSGADG